MKKKCAEIAIILLFLKGVMLIISLHAFLMRINFML